jgi:serine/threonine protein kinase
MGIVVAAMHLQLEERVALKFVLPAALSTPGIVDRFLREARAAVKLKSEHVGKVLDVGTLDNGVPFMVMEYLEGSNLDEVLTARGALPLQTAVDFVVQACRGIAEAHALGIVHRDLKPQNLFVSKRTNGEPIVKVLDFGISKVTNQLDGGLTSTQAMIGSPYYMSPEQMNSSRDVDPRTDVWSLGIILFECLTREVPFTGESMPQLVLSVMQHAPRSLAAMRPDVPPELSAIVDRCLRKSPGERFANAGELEAALVPFSSAAFAMSQNLRRLSPSTGTTFEARASQLDLEETLPKRGSKVGLFVGAVAGVVLLGIGWAVWFGRGAGSPAPSAAASPGVSVMPAVEPSATVAAVVAVAKESAPIAPIAPTASASASPALAPSPRPVPKRPALPTAITPKPTPAAPTATGRGDEIPGARR